MLHVAQLGLGGVNNTFLFMHIITDVLTYLNDIIKCFAQI